MEKWNLVKNGMSRLPPGFRFQPTDEEVVFQYLKCKILSYPLPASFIPHVNVCNYDPWDLPGDWEEEERYFFSKKEAKYRNGNRMNRTTKSGYWKATGSDKKIWSHSNYNNNDNVFGGIRKTLVFYEGKAPNGYRTNWVMHEYRLVTAETTTLNPTHLNQNYVKEVGDWVLCRICLKKRSTETGTNGDVAEPRLFDFMRVHDKGTRGGAGVQLQYSSTSSSCSSSSGITELCSSVADHQETNGYSSFDF